MFKKNYFFPNENSILKNLIIKEFEGFLSTKQFFCNYGSVCCRNDILFDIENLFVFDISSNGKKCKEFTKIKLKTVSISLHFDQKNKFDFVGFKKMIAKIDHIV